MNWILWSLSIRIKLPQASQNATEAETQKKKLGRLCAMQILMKIAQEWIISRTWHLKANEDFVTVSSLQNKEISMVKINHTESLV